MNRNLEKIKKQLSKVCGSRLKHARVNGLKCSKYRLALLASSSWTTINNIETGKSVPSMFTLAKLCNALGCEMKDICPDLKLLRQFWRGTLSVAKAA